MLISFLRFINDRTNTSNFSVLDGFSNFYKQVFASFNETKFKPRLGLFLNVEFLSLPIWHNDIFVEKDKTLFFTNWVKSNILYVKDLFYIHGNFKQIEQFRNVKNNWLCEYLRLKTIFRIYGDTFDFRNCLPITFNKNRKFLFTRKVFDNVDVKKSHKFYNTCLVEKKFKEPYMQLAPDF